MTSPLQIHFLFSGPFLLSAPRGEAWASSTSSVTQQRDAGSSFLTPGSCSIHRPPGNPLLLLRVGGKAYSALIFLAPDHA